MISLNKQLRLAAGVGLLGAVLMGSTSVSAAGLTQADCNTARGVPATRVRNEVGLQSAGDIVMTLQPDGSFQGTGLIEVFCKGPTGADLGGIQGAKVQIAATPDAGVVTTFLINNVPGPVVIGPFDSSASFTLTSHTPNLNLQVSADPNADGAIGSHTETVIAAFGQTLTGDHPISQEGGIFAATPELDSIALFGTGATGMAGYVLMRMRAARGRRQDG
jgi:hypothetical protein